MARGGKKYPLLVYRRLLGRWWTPILTMGIVLLLYVGVARGAEWYFSDPAQNPIPRLDDLGAIVLAVAGGLSIGFSLFLVSIRNFAYVQLFNDHFRIVTPFLRLNVSYKRIHRVTTASMDALFPPKKLSSWRREMLGPLLSQTANVVHLTKYPLSRFWLKFFLSPFFFADNTPHFVLLVDDWMRFGIELDSARVSGRIGPAKSSRPKMTPSLLDDLNRSLKK